MALLPALAQQINPENAAGLALPLLLPEVWDSFVALLLRKESLTRFAARSPLLLSCLALFWQPMGCFRFIRMGRACAGDDLYRASGVEYRFCGGYVWGTE